MPQLYNSSFGNMLLKPKERGAEPRAVVAAEATPWDGSHKNKSRLPSSSHTHTHISSSSSLSSGPDEKRRRLSLSTSWGDTPTTSSSTSTSKKGDSPSETADSTNKSSRRRFSNSTKPPSSSSKQTHHNPALQAKVRAELKAWETEFQSTHSRRAKQADITAVKGLCTILFFHIFISFTVFWRATSNYIYIIPFLSTLRNCSPS